MRLRGSVFQELDFLGVVSIERRIELIRKFGRPQRRRRQLFERRFCTFRGRGPADESAVIVGGDAVVEAGEVVELSNRSQQNRRAGWIASRAGSISPSTLAPRMLITMFSGTSDPGLISIGLKRTSSSPKRTDLRNPPRGMPVTSTSYSPGPT